MSLDKLYPCPRCQLNKKGWFFPELVTQFFSHEGLTEESRDAASAECVHCEGAERGLVDTIVAVEYAPAEVFEREKLSHHKAMQDLLLHVRFVCVVEWDSVPIPVRRQLIRTIYKWRNEVDLKQVLDFMPCDMQYMSKSWKIGFLQRLAELALSEYGREVLERVGIDELKSHQVAVARFADRVGKLSEPAPDDIVSILHELDELLKRV
ncbi:hypothetical protein F5Y05DRAFT_411049 [Hypoxylon sp. FL0543]|nr:hypothetical protein F5Y05DRAFT_411049 [Hypoxylon sp. FL0543]